MISAADQSLVSVVVPSFNHSAYIEECLESIVQQTHRRLEVIIVDDASTDGTRSILEKLVDSRDFRNRFEGRVSLLAQTRNIGADRALNLGIRASQGEFLAICNSDDRFHPNRVSSLMSMLQQEPMAQLAFGAVRMVDARGEDVTEEDWFGISLSHLQRAIRAYPTVGFALLHANVALSSGNLFFRRELFQRLSGFRPLVYCHDWDFVLRSVLVAEPLFEPSLLYDYRLHDSNSFRSLGAVADRETRLVLRAYFSAIRCEDYDNIRAPGPRTWPEVFRQMLAVMGFREHWQRSERSPE